MNVTGDSTDVSTYFQLSLVADGTDATGLTITDLDLQYVRSGVAPVAKVDATALAATDSAHSDNKAIEIDATDQPGLYRVDWPDAAFAAGVKEVILTVKCANVKTQSLRVTIDAPVNVTKLLGTAWLTPGTAGTPDVNVKLAGGTAWNSGAIGANTIATDAIDSDALAASAVTEIQSGLATSASISALNNLSAAQVNSEVDTALADIRLDELLAADSDIDGAAPPTVGSVFHELMSATAGSFTFDQLTDSLEALRNRGDAAWITATGFSTHTAADVWANGTRTLTDKTGFSLASTGLDLVTLPANLITATSIAANAITAAKLATDCLTSSQLAASAVTEIQNGLSTLDAAGIRNAVGLASANLDTQLDALPTAAENASQLLGTAIESGVTLQQCIQAIAAAAAGKRSGSNTDNEQIDAIGNPGTARIVTNADAAGDGTPTLSL